MTKKIQSLTCRETTYLVTAARDTSLDAEQLAALDKHLETCSACRTAKQQFAQMFDQLDTLLARDKQP